MPGEIVYFTIGTPDTGKAQEFYGGLFGWSFAPGTVDDGFQIDGASPAGGLHGQKDGSGPRVYFAVDDIQAAVQRVRELGGDADEPTKGSYGWSANCTDDQGVMFSLYSTS